MNLHLDEGFIDDEHHPSNGLNSGHHGVLNGMHSVQDTEGQSGRV
jgi:hypothetical protein